MEEQVMGEQSREEQLMAERSGNNSGGMINSSRSISIEEQVMGEQSREEQLMAERSGNNSRGMINRPGSIIIGEQAIDPTYDIEAGPVVANGTAQMRGQRAFQLQTTLGFLILIGCLGAYYYRSIKVCFSRDGGAECLKLASVLSEQMEDAYEAYQSNRFGAFVFEWAFRLLARLIEYLFF